MRQAPDNTRQGGMYQYLVLELPVKPPASHMDPHAMDDSRLFSCVSDLSRGDLAAVSHFWPPLLEIYICTRWLATRSSPVQQSLLNTLLTGTTYCAHIYSFTWTHLWHRGPVQQ
jgi:hypothetical protein